ncbi:MAG: NAD(P)H-dependent glycerol-3-phosphate dehydrogenase [Maricaulaceae bacterium]
MSVIKTIGVFGAGAWGTALAEAAARAGRSITLWAREAEVAHSVNTDHRNAVFLPDARLSDTVRATTALADLARCDAVLAVVPAQHMRAALQAFAPFATPDLPIVLCAKGVERGSWTLMSQVLAETLPQARAAALSGPSFAIDVARGLPTAVTLACPEAELRADLISALGRPEFRPYASDDLVGAEVGGAVKNVLAIACGVAEGKGLGKSAHAALLTRGFAEMVRLGAAMGAKPETLNGLCGLGDLVLTCSSPQSRNMSCGLALGRGEPLDAILNARQAVTEGVATAPGVTALAQRYGVDMPVCQAVADIVSGALSVEAAITGLLSRPFRAEGG